MFQTRETSVLPETSAKFSVNIIRAISSLSMKQEQTLAQCKSLGESQVFQFRELKNSLGLLTSQINELRLKMCLCIRN